VAYTYTGTQDSRHPGNFPTIIKEFISKHT
jgi:hypothetical protein